MSSKMRLYGGVLALGLMTLPVTGRAQQGQRGQQGQQGQQGQEDRAREHGADDLRNLTPMELVRDLQNTGRMIFVMADINHDGQISQKEAANTANLAVGGFFFEADEDGNGSVSQEEVRKIRESYLNQNPWMKYVVESLEAQAKQKNQQNSNQVNPLAGLATIVDSNNDKQVQSQELRQFIQTVVQSYFAAADTNRDGQMNPSEVNASVVGVVRAMSQLAFQQADKDGNGQLSRDEYDKSIIEPANVVFQIIDLNHDGQLSEQEVQKTERIVVDQIRMVQLPEPDNSPTNLIESGKLPGEAAPVPSFGTPNAGQNRNRNRNQNPNQNRQQQQQQPAPPR